MIDYESQHRLDFGGLDFTGVEDYEGARFYAMADGATLGNPVPVERSIETALLDGSFVVTESHGNREPAWQVWIEAPDSVALAYGEKLLFEQCARRVEMGWTPPDGWGPRTVYEAFTSSLTHQFDDMLEMRLVRSYLLRVVAAPFGYSEDEVSDVASVAPGSATTVVISDGTSTTGWTPHAPGAATSTITVVSGALVVTNWTSSGYEDAGYLRGKFEFEATRALSPVVDFTTTEYVTADVRISEGGPEFWASVDGVPLVQVASSLVTSSGGPNVYRVTWRCRDTSASTLTLSANGYTYVPIGVTGPTPTFVIDNVQRSDQVPASGNTTGRQTLRTVDITGSARTAGSVAIEHETAGLGDVLFYTSPELGIGYSPDMSRWLDPASTSTNLADAANVTGRSYVNNSTGLVYNVPAHALPAGPHLLMARVKSTLADTLTWTASTVVGTTVMATQTGTVAVPAGGVYSVLTLGIATLPTVDVPALTGAVIRFTMKGTQVNTPTFDELWSYLLDEDSDLTQIACGTGTPALGTVHNRAFIDAPSLANEGRPGLFIGTTADRLDSFHPGYPTVRAWGRHPLAPDKALMHIVTTGATNPSVTLRHRPAWHTHAGQ